MNKRKCPRCKVAKNKTDWAKGAWTNTTYCKSCQRFYNSKKRDKAHEKIMKATNNGKAWWLLQAINAERHFRKSEN